MLDYVAHRSKQFEKTINTDLFNRNFDKPLHEFIVATCRNFNVIPGLELDSYELIEDQSKINIVLNKKLYKDKNIKKNRAIEKLVTPKRSDTDLLKLTFKKTVDGITEYITRQMLILHQDENGYYFINGKKVLPIIQVVDISTFVSNEALNFKALIMGIKLQYKTIKMKTSEGDVKGNAFFIDLFTKKVNPLLYYIAEMGFFEMLEYFDMKNGISLTSEIIDKEKYLYTHLPNNLYLEMDKKLLKSDFATNFYATLVDCCMKSTKVSSYFSREHWLERLSEEFGKISVKNGKHILISFRRIMDRGTLSRLRGFKPRHRKNTYTVVRYLMQNYDAFMKKDNHDLQNKRIRVNEVLALHFETYVTKNINSLLGNDRITSERIDKLLNSIHEKTFLRAVNSHELFRYEKYNDLDAINLSRYTFKGPSGINGDKYKVALVHRDIYPSHLGRFDLNVCSASNPGLTGYITANVKLYDGTYFSDRWEPDDFARESKKLNDKMPSEYHKDRYDRIMLESLKNEEGKLILRRRLSQEEKVHLVMENPELHGLYKRFDNKLILMPTYKKDKLGRVVLVRKKRNMGLDPKKFKFDYAGRVILTWREGKKPSKKKK